MSSSDIKVRNAAQAVNEVVAYLQKNKVPDAPDAGSSWQEKPLYSTAIQDYAITSRLFTAGDWQIEVYQNVAPLSSTVYQVTVFNGKLHRCWKGSVKADGSVMESSAFRTLSEEESRKLAGDLTKKIQVPAPRPGGYGH